MIDLFELYKDFNAINNTSQNGFWRPEKDFERNANEASVILWNKKIDEANKSNKITDDLSPFFVSKNIIVKNANSFYGVIDKPSKKGEEYGRWGGARLLVAGNNACVPDKNVDNGNCSNGNFKTEQELTDEYYNTVSEVQIEKIDSSRWTSVLNHLTKRPTLANPKITQVNDQFQVAPRQVSVVILNYYVQPKKAVFKYTVSSPNIVNGSGDEIVYDKTNSTPLQWPETVKDELLAILKDVYIGFTRDSKYAQITNIQKATP